MPKNKTKKNIKKRKKIKGGFECNLCDPSERRSTRLSESLCGKEQCKMCLNCAKKSCISSSLPEYRNQEAKQPKCPYCNETSEEVTQKCLEITKSDTIEDMISREKSRLPTEPVFNIQDLPQEEEQQGTFSLNVHDPPFDLLNMNDMIIYARCLNLLSHICKVAIPIQIVFVITEQQPNNYMSASQYLSNYTATYINNIQHNRFHIHELNITFNDKLIENGRNPNELPFFINEFRIFLQNIRTRLENEGHSQMIRNLSRRIKNHLNSLLQRIKIDTYAITENELYALYQINVDLFSSINPQQDPYQNISDFYQNISLTHVNIMEHIKSMLYNLCYETLEDQPETMVGGTKKKSLKKTDGLDGKHWKMNDGYDCPICGRALRNQRLETICQNGHKVCKTCVKDFCKKSATPTYLEQGPQPVKCPICRVDVTLNCLRLTGANNIEELADLSNVPTFDQLYTPQAALATAEAAELPNENDFSVNGDMSEGQLEMPDYENDLLRHLEDGEISDLETVIEIMNSSISYGISQTLIQDITGAGTIAREPGNIIADIDHHFGQNGSPRFDSTQHRYGADNLNRKYIQWRISQGERYNPPNYIAKLTAVSRRIKARLYHLVDYTDLDIDEIKKEMLSYICNSTLINDNDAQSNFFITLYTTLASQGAVGNSDWQSISIILYRIMDILRFHISREVNHIFANYHGSGGRRKTKKSLKKRRKTIKKRI